MKYKILTVVNEGYILLLDNLRASLREIGLLDNLYVYAVGEKCHQALNKKGIKNTLITDSLVSDKKVSFNTSKWKRVVYQKMRAINLFLEKNDSFLYVDPDVVFKKDLFPYFRELPLGYDIYAQKDVPKSEICSGFMYIQKNSNTEKLFAVSWKDFDKETPVGDQIYINKKDDILKLYSLDEKLFVNGSWFNHFLYTEPYFLKDAYIVHYNYTQCLSQKLLRMRKNGDLKIKLKIHNFFYFFMRDFPVFLRITIKFIQRN